MSGAKPTVLLVDDELPFLRGTARWLRAHAGVKVRTARDGAQAAAILREEGVDLVVTDLQMPVMDGFELLAHMSREHADVPVMAMTAQPTPGSAERARDLGTVTFFEKPFDLQALSAAIDRVIEGRARGFLQGISIPAILQLLELERKTAAIRIARDGRKAVLTFVDGRLVDASLGDRRGDAAAMEVIAWEHARVVIDPASRSTEETVGRPLHFLMMEALRLADEGRAAVDEGSWGDGDAGWGEEPSEPVLAPETLAALEAALAALLEVKGVRGALLLDGRGSVLAEVVAKKGGSGLAAAADALRALSRGALEATAVLDLGPPTEVSTGTPAGLLVVVPSPADGPSFVLAALIAWRGDHAALPARLAEAALEAARALALR